MATETSEQPPEMVETTGQSDSSENNVTTSESSLEIKLKRFQERVERMSAWEVFLVWFALALSNLCVFLDEGIISTAIPRITDKFQSLGDVGVSQYSSRLRLLSHDNGHSGTAPRITSLSAPSSWCMDGFSTNSRSKSPSWRPWPFSKSVRSSVRPAPTLLPSSSAVPSLAWERQACRAAILRCSLPLSRQRSCLCTWALWGWCTASAPS